MLIVWWWACGTASSDRAPQSAVAHVKRAQPVAVEPIEEAGASIVAMGDILVHEAVEEAAEDFAVARGGSTRTGYVAIFEGIQPLVRAADVAFANLESPVAPSGFRPRRPRVFNADPLLVDSLVETGFDLVSLANNHAFDQGPQGLEETMDVLTERRLGYVGVGSSCDAAQRPVVIRRRGIEIAFLAATEFLNANWNVREDATCTAMLRPEAILARARAAREDGADFVVLSVHWGDEYEADPGPARRRVAHRLVEGGVDVILGHHAHVLQPVELHETRDGRVALIAYGLGNLVSNQAAWYVPGRHRPRSARPRDGLALSFRLSRRRAGRGPDAEVRREIVDVEAIPLWTVNNEPTRRYGSDTEIRVLPTRDALAELLDDDDPDARHREAWVEELRERASRVERQATPIVATPRPGPHDDAHPEEWRSGGKVDGGK